MGMPAFKELTLNEALELTNQAIEKLQSDLASLALEHPVDSLSPQYVNTLLQRRKENKAARDRMRLVFLELISREFSIRKEE
jgi:hypothetical protein